jgi:hypothetical protein
VNHGLTAPEAGFEAALNLEVAQLQFDDRNMPRKITARVGDANVQSGDTDTPGLCFDYHAGLPFELR